MRPYPRRGLDGRDIDHQGVADHAWHGDGGAVGCHRGGRGRRSQLTARVAHQSPRERAANGRKVRPRHRGAFLDVHREREQRAIQRHPEAPRSHVGHVEDVSRLYPRFPPEKIHAGNGKKLAPGLVDGRAELVDRDVRQRRRRRGALDEGHESALRGQQARTIVNRSSRGLTRAPLMRRAAFRDMAPTSLAKPACDGAQTQS